MTLILLSQYLKTIMRNHTSHIFNALYEGFYLDQLEYLSLWNYASVLLLYAPKNLSEDHEHKVFISQRGISESREIFFKISKAHRAQKDISEAYEQIPSSKRYKRST